MISETKVTRQDKVLLLSRRQFVAWHVHKEMMSESEALQKWHTNLQDRRVYRETSADGGIVMAVRGPTEVILANSVAKRRRLGTAFACDDNDDARDRLAGMLGNSVSVAPSAAAFAGVGGNLFAPGAPSSASSSTDIGFGSLGSGGPSLAPEVERALLGARRGMSAPPVGESGEARAMAPCGDDASVSSGPSMHMRRALDGIDTLVGVVAAPAFLGALTLALRGAWAPLPSSRRPRRSKTCQEPRPRRPPWLRHRVLGRMDRSRSRS